MPSCRACHPHHHEAEPSPAACNPAEHSMAVRCSAVLRAIVALCNTAQMHACTSHNNNQHRLTSQPAVVHSPKISQQTNSLLATPNRRWPPFANTATTSQGFERRAVPTRAKALATNLQTPSRSLKSSVCNTDFEASPQTKASRKTRRPRFRTGPLGLFASEAPGRKKRLKAPSANGSCAVQYMHRISHPRISVRRSVDRSPERERVM
jgi:hypothetical protein